MEAAQLRLYAPGRGCGFLCTKKKRGKWSKPHFVVLEHGALQVHKVGSRLGGLLVRGGGLALASSATATFSLFFTESGGSFKGSTRSLTLHAESRSSCAAWVAALRAMMGSRDAAASSAAPVRSIFEGVLVGLIGAGFTLLILLAASPAISDLAREIAGQVTLFFDPRLSLQITALVLLAGIGFGGLGAWISVRAYIHH